MKLFITANMISVHFNYDVNHKKIGQTYENNEKLALLPFPWSTGSGENDKYKK